MIKLYDGGVYLVGGTKIVSEAEAASAPELNGANPKEAAKGTIDAASLGLTKTADGYSTRIKRGRYTLTIALSEPDASGSYEIDEWKITKEWNAEDPVQNIWKGD